MLTYWGELLPQIGGEMASDGPMIDYNQKSVGLDSWTDDQAQS